MRRRLLLSGGAVSAGLDVDSQSPTGAHLLYEQVGMAATLTIGQFEHEIVAAGAGPVPRSDG